MNNAIDDLAIHPLLLYHPRHHPVDWLLPRPSAHPVQPAVPVAHHHDDRPSLLSPLDARLDDAFVPPDFRTDDLYSSFVDHLSPSVAPPPPAPAPLLTSASASTPPLPSVASPVTAIHTPTSNPAANPNPPTTPTAAASTTAAALRSQSLTTFTSSQPLQSYPPQHLHHPHHPSTYQPQNPHHHLLFQPQQHQQQYHQHQYHQQQQQQQQQLPHQSSQKHPHHQHPSQLHPQPPPYPSPPPLQLQPSPPAPAPQPPNPPPLAIPSPRHHRQWFQQHLLQDRSIKLDDISSTAAFAAVTTPATATSSPAEDSFGLPVFDPLKVEPHVVATSPYFNHNSHLTMPTLALIAKPADLSKPINALGPLCFAGFYLVSLTRTIVRNRTVPVAVRQAFMAPQLHHRFTVRDPRDHKWRNIPTVQIPYDSLSAAGDWLRGRLSVTDEAYTFKHIKDALQKAVTDAWSHGAWNNLVQILHVQFPGVTQQDLDDVLESESISGRAKGTPRQFFKQINCHKGAADIRRDVDGAISARESLRWVLGHLGLNPSGCNISISKFRDEVFPLWKHQCPYVREHTSPNCCQFYDGGYFKKIMIHKHLYNVNGCSSSYHVKDLFEGLDEVIKVWSNPTGMCVREAKCAAGLRYNVDKSFQSGIRSYSKSKFLEAAPHTANEFVELGRKLHERVQNMLRMKQKKHFKCRKALRDIEVESESLSQRQLPEMLQRKAGDMMVTPTSPTSAGSSVTSPTLRKRKRQERDNEVQSPSTPREQKRKHAHLSLRRKEAAEQRVRQYLELLREDCQRQQSLLDSVKYHGDTCSCQEPHAGEMATGPRYPTSANVPVA